MTRLPIQARKLLFVTYLIRSAVFWFLLGIPLSLPLRAISMQVFLFFWIIGLPVLLIIFSYLWAHLAYPRYGYEISEEGFRFEHGVIYKSSVIIPYGRIQNIEITEGLIARKLGICVLQIYTAGSSGDVGALVRGITRNVAKQLQDDLLNRMQHAKQSEGI